MHYSPALSVTSDFTDEELDQYFASYVPLSCLPTPPPAKVVPVARITDVSAEDVPAKTAEQNAHATYLSKLMPSNLSAHAPSIPTIRDFLIRANLPIEMLAFTACILDALSHRFASSWRTASLPSTPTPFKYIPLFANLRRPTPVRPEVVVLAALSLAHGWLDDGPKSNAHWACVEGASKFSSRDVDIARMCILKDVDYALFKINGEMVGCMTEDLQRAATKTSKSEAHGNVGAVGRRTRTSVAEKEKEKRPKLSIELHGTAVWVHGIATPEPSP